MENWHLPAAASAFAVGGTAGSAASVAATTGPGSATGTTVRPWSGPVSIKPYLNQIWHKTKREKQREKQAQNNNMWTPFNIQVHTLNCTNPFSMQLPNKHSAIHLGSRTWGNGPHVLSKWMMSVCCLSMIAQSTQITCWWTHHWIFWQLLWHCQYKLLCKHNSSNIIIHF